MTNHQKLTLEIYTPKETGKKNRIPFYTEQVSAGFPSPAEDYIEKKLDLNELVIKHPSASYFVKVSGHSMKDSGINDGDILVVDRAIDPKNNDVIIAVLNGELTVKRIKKTRKELFLLPENSDFEPIKVNDEADFQVWGVVTTVIHRMK